MAHIIQSFLFAFASFFGVVALAVDRFLAMQFHLRYQELVTQKRVVAVVFSLWVLSAFLSIRGNGFPKRFYSVCMQR